MGTIIKRCSVSKILHIKESNAGAFTVCFFTSNLKGQAQSFPENIQTYGATAYFKVSSQHLPAKLLEKMSFDLEGHWEKDKYGKTQNEQVFVAEKASESMPETHGEIVKFLVKNCKGVGKVMAEAVAASFGESTLDICAHKPRRLLGIPKMTETLLGNINYACVSALVRSDVQTLLKNADVGVEAINKLVEAYGDEATNILKSEPYRPVDLLGFLTTDKIAVSLGEAPDSERRLRAATKEAQKRACSKTGNMCAELSSMLTQMRELTPDVDETKLTEAVDKASAAFNVVKQGQYYYNKNDFITERDMASKIAEFANEKPTKEKEIEKAFLEWQKENAMILSPKQAEAVRNLRYRISIVTGGPGTGKTTCLRAIMDVYHKVWPSEHILLMAPTGLAAKRMAESTGMNSATIHKACGLVPADNPSGFAAQGECRICGFVGIDEMSMVGEHQRSSPTRGTPLFVLYEL